MTDSDSVELPYLRVANVQDGFVDLSDVKTIRTTFAEATRYRLEPGDVLMTEGGDFDKLGRGTVWRGQLDPCIHQNHIFCVRVQPDLLNPDFLAAIARSPYGRSYFARSSKQTTNLASINSTQLKAFPIPLPSLPEQRRIADILDRAEALRAKRRAALAQLDELNFSIFDHLFSSQDWARRHLESVVRSDTIVTYGIVQAGEECPGGVPYIRTGDLVDGQIRLEGLRHTTADLAAKYQRSRVEMGEIVMSIRATVGTTALVPPALHGANLTQGTARISPGKEVDSLFLLHFLRSSDAQQWIAKETKGITFREITLTRLRQLPVPVPPLPLQQEFARRVQALDRLKAKHRQSLAEMDALFQSLQHRAFRGEL